MEDTWIFLAALFFITIVAFMIWATVSKRRTDKKLHDPNASKSTLAADGPGPNPATAPRREGVSPQGRRE